MCCYAVEAVVRACGAGVVSLGIERFRWSCQCYHGKVSANILFEFVFQADRRSLFLFKFLSSGIRGYISERRANHFQNQIWRDQLFSKRVFFQTKGITKSICRSKAICTRKLFAFVSYKNFSNFHRPLLGVMSELWKSGFFWIHFLSRLFNTHDNDFTLTQSSPHLQGFLRVFVCFCTKSWRKIMITVEPIFQIPIIFGLREIICSHWSSQWQSQDFSSFNVN